MAKKIYEGELLLREDDVLELHMKDPREWPFIFVKPLINQMVVFYGRKIKGLGCWVPARITVEEEGSGGKIIIEVKRVE